MILRHFFFLPSSFSFSFLPVLRKILFYFTARGLLTDELMTFPCYYSLSCFQPFFSSLLLLVCNLVRKRVRRRCTEPQKEKKHKAPGPQFCDIWQSYVGIGQAKEDETHQWDGKRVYKMVCFVQIGFRCAEGVLCCRVGHGINGALNDWYNQLPHGHLFLSRS